MLSIRLFYNATIQASLSIVHLLLKLKMGSTPLKQRCRRFSAMRTITSTLPIAVITNTWILRHRATSTLTRTIMMHMISMSVKIQQYLQYCRSISDEQC